jgi:hypothetical protein
MAMETVEPKIAPSIIPFRETIEGIKNSLISRATYHQSYAIYRMASSANGGYGDRRGGFIVGETITCEDYILYKPI